MVYHNYHQQRKRMTTTTIVDYVKVVSVADAFQ